jgi:CHAT domain-containing protein/tetratricopeptide (TPR) repeat protein
MRPCIALVFGLSWTAVSAAGIVQAPGDVTAFSRIRQLIDRGEYEQADREAQRIAGGLTGEAQLEANDLLVESAVKNGRGSDAGIRALAEAQARERNADSQARARAGSARLFTLASLYFATSEYQQAVRLLEQLVRLSDEQYDLTDDLRAEFLAYYAEALAQVGRRDEAAIIASRAVAVVDRREPSAVLARALTSRGIVALWQGQYPTARGALERAVSIRQALGEQHPDTARALSMLGRVLLLQGRLSESRKTLERALDLAEHTLRSGHPLRATYFRDMALVLQELGDLAEARSLKERAVAITAAAVPHDSPELAVQLNDLADTMRLQGEYTAALPIFERALAIFEQQLGPEHSYTTTAVYNLSLVHARLGDRARAVPLHQRAIASWQKSYGRDHAVIASTMWEFAQILAEQSFDRDAVPIFERSLAMQRRIFGERHQAVAQSLSSLAFSLAHLGQTQRARTLSEQALRIWRDLGDNTSPGFATSLLLHGRVLARRSDDEGAIQAFREAKTVRLALLGPSHPGVAEVDVALAESLARAGHPEEALSLGLDGEQLGRSHLSLLLRSLPERQALTYAATRPKGLDVVLSVVTPERSEAALDTLVRGRSLVFDEIASRRQTDLIPGTDLADARAKLNSARQRLANLTIRGPSDANVAQYAAMLRDAQFERDEAERALSARSAAFRQELRREDVSLDQIRRSLAPGSALVSFARYNRLLPKSDGAAPAAGNPMPVPSYMAFVLTANSAAPELVPLGSVQQIDLLITTWRRRLIEEITEPPEQNAGVPSSRALGATLRRRIWEPLAPHLSAAGRVFVVPDGALNLVPLAALPTTPGRYLVDDGPTFHYVSAERDLLTTRPATEVGKGLLAIGNPAFSDASSFSKPAKAAGPSQSISRIALRGASPCTAVQGMRFDSIPGAGREATSVSRLWMGLDSSQSTDADLTLLGAGATERAFKQLGPGRRVLHIATHGFFLGPDCEPIANGTRAVGGLVPTMPPVKALSRPSTPQPENPLLLSGLALAGANRRMAAGPEDEDGILTAEEVAGLNLDGVEWAVLSACDTGLGTVAAGEGVFGLRRAFQVAGARTVIMSLWSVSDRATQEWMEALYRARLGQQLDTADAVRQASLEMLRSRRARHSSTSPFYWAAFVAAGDWH